MSDRVTEYFRRALRAHLRSDTDPCSNAGVGYPCAVARAFADLGQYGPRPADLHRDQAKLARDALLGWRRPFKVVEHPTLVDDMVVSTLDNLREDLDAVILGRCPHRPETRRGQPIGQYHCPRCGCMVVAGVELHPHEGGCLFGLNND